MAEQRVSWLPRLRRQRQSLTTTFVIGVLCVLLPVAVLLALLGQQRRERDRQAALGSLTQTAESIARIADGTLDEGLKLTQTIATAPPVRTMDPAIFLPRLRELHVIYPGYSTLSVVDQTGVVLGTVGDDPPRSDLSPAQREALNRVAGTRAPGLFVGPSPVAADRLDGGVIAPMLRNDGSVMGAVVATFDVRGLGDRLRELRTAPDQGLALIDSSGRLVLALSPSGVVVADGLSWDERARGAAPEVQTALRGEIAVSHAFVSPVLADERLGVWVPTRKYGWVASATWPVAAAMAPSRIAERDELVIFATIVVVMVIGSVLAARMGVRPLQRLAEHADRLGEGDFQPVLGLQSNDEIGRLAGAFNRMGQRLRQTLDDLHDERAHLESVLAQLPIGVVVISAEDGTVIRTNGLSERFLARTARSPGRYSPDDPSYAFHLNGRPLQPEERHVERALRNGESVRSEEILLRLPGVPEIVLNVNAAPIRDRDGRVVAAVQTIEDVTERRLADARLRQHEAILQTLIDQFPAVISVVDREYQILMRGGQQSLIRGPVTEDLTGRDLSTVLQADDFERFRQVAERAFAGEVTPFEGTRSGRSLRGTISPLRDATGAIDKVLSVAFDVTEAVAREERAARDEKLRALGQMASGIAHDLNQALTLVSGYGELAREALACDGPNPSPACEMVRIMERAAYDGGATVRRLLTFARGQEHEQRQAVDVGVLLHDVEQLTAPRWRDATRAEGRRVTLSVEAGPGLAISGSQAELRELLTNLVFNALDAMPRGGSIALTARPVDGHVLIDVADTGTGMPPEVKARIFEPFFTTKGEGGSGLGMAMVFGIVQRHAGQIEIDTEAGRGTTIHLMFPVADLERSAAAPEAAPETVRACRILVVDDEPRLSALLVGLLRQKGHEGVTAISAEEALERLAVESFDLVISDLSMGDGMNGWDLAAVIAASNHPIPVVLATGWGAGIDEDEARQRGVSGVVAKPYRRSDLYAAVGQALAGRT